MRSLFVKIFLWFWLASILIIASTLVMMSFLEPFEPLREDGRFIRRLTNFGRTAVEVLEREGPDALQNFVRHKKRGPGRHVSLFDENLNLVAGKHPPPEVKELAERARKSGATEFQRSDRRILLAQTVYGKDGNYYIMTGELPHRPKRPPLNRILNSRFMSVRLLVIFIVASIFCYWLAWYLASPARKLRKAAQQFASGNLKTRVGPELGDRKDELADLGHDFDLMAERIEDLINAQGRLLRDISHELRSPLARLNVALELARQRSGKEAEEHLDRIELESERMNKLIGQLRTLMLMENGHESMDRKELNLSNLVKVISDDADFEAKSRNCSVQTDLVENIMVDGSEELLNRAIENVVRNAIRYTNEGSEVEISLQPLKLDGRDSTVLEVRDHGPGVPEETLKNLFIPFYRVAEARDRQSGGMGIGLAITDRAVKLHGGKVKAFNANDGGLIIRIELPSL